jgi:hypothetical protein
VFDLLFLKRFFQNLPVGDNSMNSIETGLSNIELKFLAASYKFGTKIEQTNDPVWSRVYATAIPFFCFLGETAKAVNDVNRLLSMVYRSFKTKKIVNGNVQSGVVHVCEHLRNLAGTVSGLFFGVYSPQESRKAFLTVKAEKLQTKLNQDAAARLYSLGFALSKFFTQHNIDYRICSGSLLGAVRHKGIIPWDDDIDLMLHPTSIKKFKALVEDGTFTKQTGLGIKWQNFTGGWQCFHQDSPKGRGLLEGIGTPFVDIFCTKIEKKEKRIVYINQEMQKLSTGDYFTINEWNKSKKYPFGPIELISIQKAVPYISRCYGRDSLNFASQTMHHDVLAGMHQNPFDIKGNLSKIWKYGLPRRTFIADKSPIVYDKKAFKKYIQNIHGCLSAKNEVEMSEKFRKTDSSG